MLHHRAPSWLWDPQCCGRWMSHQCEWSSGCSLHGSGLVLFLIFPCVLGWGFLKVTHSCKGPAGGSMWASVLLMLGSSNRTLRFHGQMGGTQFGDGFSSRYRLGSLFPSILFNAQQDLSIYNSSWYRWACIWWAIFLSGTWPALPCIRSAG